MGLKKHEIIPASGLVCEFCCTELHTINVFERYYACDECFEAKSRRKRLLAAEEEWDDKSHDDTTIRN